MLLLSVSQTAAFTFARHIKNFILYRWWTQLTSPGQRPTHFNDLQGPWQVLGWCFLGCASGSEVFQGGSQKAIAEGKLLHGETAQFHGTYLASIWILRQFFSKLLISDLAALYLFLFTTITPPISMVNEQNLNKTKMNKNLRVNSFTVQCLVTVDRLFSALQSITEKFL